MNELFMGILPPAVVALLITAITTPIFIPILKRYKFLDDPKKRSHPGVIHKIPIPRGGSIPFFLGVLISTLIFLPLSRVTGAIFAAAGISLIMGVIDDKYDVSPYFRFVINIFCALLVVAAGVSVPYITNPLGGILFLNQFGFGFFNLANLVAVLWIVWVMNMLNWSKGVDGQMPGIVAISAIFIGILSLRFGIVDEPSQISTLLSFIVAGASLGFLIYNFHPAKIFPGYGATAIYLLLAVVSILSGAKLATAILVMGVPLADGAYTITRRILTGHSPFWHDKKHLHHLLLSSGVGQRKVALFYWIVSAILGSLSLILNSRGKAFAIIMVIIIVGGALLFLNYLIWKKNVKQSL
jgi:UDP-GlcNAc:undecaprenyl-phosphate GlcNAc-1-phosphate transferase